MFLVHSIIVKVTNAKHGQKTDNNDGEKKKEEQVYYIKYYIILGRDIFFFTGKNYLYCIFKRNEIKRNSIFTSSSTTADGAIKLYFFL